MVAEEQDLIELFVEHDEELKRLAETLPQFWLELNEQLKAHFEQSIIENAGKSRMELETQLAASREQLIALARSEIQTLHEKAQASVHAMESRGDRIADVALTRVGKLESDVPARIQAAFDLAFGLARKEMAEQARVDATREVARVLEAAPKTTFFDWFTGNWKKDRLYKPGELFAFRGSTYIVYREVIRIFPTQQNQKEPNPIFGIIAATGSPGPRGIDGAGGGGGGGGWVTPPASASASGTQGTMSYAGGYLYVCIATNTWRRCPLVTF